MFFRKISCILTDYFVRNFINENELFGLNEKELLILKEIMKKKFGIDFDNFTKKKKCVRVFLKKLENIKKIGSKKRAEEKMKFVYKNSLKSLKNKYINESCFARNKFELDDFYNHYFRKIIEKQKLGLVDFYDPLNSKVKNNKSLNSKYLNLIFQSEKFKFDFFQYYDFFKYYYIKSLTKKIEIFFINFEKSFLNKKMENKEDIFDQVIFYLKTSKKVKFPWTHFEIDNALLYFKKKIDDKKRI